MGSTPEGEAPRISKESNDRSFMHLMETTQWFIDCMGEGAMEPGGSGWASTMRVRFTAHYHAAAATRKEQARMRDEGLLSVQRESRRNPHKPRRYGVNPELFH
jgi:hypothetical protein